MEQVLHLFITNDCRHNCKLCCNKLYKIPEIPVVTVELLKSVQTVCLTGGEPLSINKGELGSFITRLRKQYSNIENLYVYTSGYELSTKPHIYVRESLWKGDINGINVAPKDFKDWAAFAYFIDGFRRCREFDKSIFEKMSNRLYVFKEQKPLYEAMDIDLHGLKFNVIDRQWDITFNTPENEHFARLPILFDCDEGYGK